MLLTTLLGVDQMRKMTAEQIHAAEDKMIADLVNHTLSTPETLTVLKRSVAHK